MVPFYAIILVYLAFQYRHRLPCSVQRWIPRWPPEDASKMVMQVQGLVMLGFLGFSVSHIVYNLLALISLLSGADFVSPQSTSGFVFGTAQSWAATASFLLMVVSSLVTICSNYGPPPIREENRWQKCQEYLQKLTLQTEFQWLMYAFILVNCTILPVFTLLALALPARRAMWIVLTYVDKKLGPQAMEQIPNGKSVIEMWRQLKTQQAMVTLYSGLGEILLGIAFVGTLLTPERQVISAFIYWNWLKIRYQTAKDKTALNQAWQMVDAKFAPLSALPGVGRIKQKAVDWFQRP